MESAVGRCTGVQDCRGRHQDAVPERGHPEQPLTWKNARKGPRTESEAAESVPPSNCSLAAQPPPASIGHDGSHEAAASVAGAARLRNMNQTNASAQRREIGGWAGINEHVLAAFTVRGLSCTLCFSKCQRLEITIRGRFLPCSLLLLVLFASRVHRVVSGGLWFRFWKKLCFVEAVGLISTVVEGRCQPGAGMQLGVQLAEAMRAATAAKLPASGVSGGGPRAAWPRAAGAASGPAAVPARQAAAA